MKSQPVQRRAPLSFFPLGLHHERPATPLSLFHPHLANKGTRNSRGLWNRLLTDVGQYSDEPISVKNVFWRMMPS